MPESLLAAMVSYHETLSKAGVLLDANGLLPSSGLARQYDAQGERKVLDGPFAETKELIAGYTMIQARSREEAMQWAQRFPSPFPGQPCSVEVRQLYELEDFAPSPPSNASATFRATDNSRYPEVEVPERYALPQGRRYGPEAKPTVALRASALRASLRTGKAGSAVRSELGVLDTVFVSTSDTRKRHAQAYVRQPADPRHEEIAGLLPQRGL